MIKYVKRAVNTLFTTLMLFALVACGQQPKQQEQPQQTDQAQQNDTKEHEVATAKQNTHT